MSQRFTHSLDPVEVQLKDQMGQGRGGVWPLAAMCPKVEKTQGTVPDLMLPTGESLQPESFCGPISPGVWPKVTGLV